MLPPDHADVSMTRPVVDSHVHLWDLDRFRYPWLDQLPAIRRSFRLADFDAAVDDLAIETMVFVQAECRPDEHMEELRWAQSLADLDPRLRGIVPWVPLELGDAIAPDLESMTKDHRVKGIRRIIQFEHDPDFGIRPGFVRGVRMLAYVGLHFEITMSPSQMPQVMRLVEACPDTSFILDHAGNPDIKAGFLGAWGRQLAEFAASGPHRCKLSNLVCNADLEHWTLDDIRPVVDVVIEAFTPDRVIWGSDWPHVLRASSYRRWLESAETLIAYLSEGDQRKIFHDNAQSFYRLVE